MTDWVRRSRDGAVAPVAGAAVAIKRPHPELEALNALRRWELASAELDLEIAKGAAAHFAKESR